MATATEALEQIKERVQMVPVSDARDEIESGVRLVDVREQHEWDESHLERAIHVPQGEVVERIDELAPRPLRALILLHCRTDNRSARVADDAARARLRGRRRDRGRHRRLGATPGTPWSRQRPDARAARPLLAPHPASRDRGRGPAQAPEREGPACSGAGGLGSPTALYLAAAGVGTIGIVDDDVVDASNLQRQVIHTTDRVGVAEDGVGAGRDRGAQPRRQRDRAQPPPRRLEHPRAARALRHRSSTAPTTSRRATC